MRRRIGLLAAGLLAVSACGDVLPYEPDLTPSLDIDPDSASESLELGVLSGGFGSEAWGVSASGVVVGVSFSASAERAFVWTPDSGMQDLGTFGGSSSSATAVSDAGMIVGYADSANGASVAFRFTAEGGMVPLGGTTSSANDVNDDGVIVGRHEVGFDTHAFRWSESDGFVDLGVIGDGYRSEATAINAGGVIVGLSSIGTGGIRAFRLVPGDTMTSLGTLPGHSVSTAYDINDDGVIVGWSGPNSANARAFVWTEAAGMQQLPSRAGTVRAEEALAITDDGDIVGFSTDGAFQPRAVLWTPNGSGGYAIHDVGGPGSKAFGVDEAGYVVGYVNSGSNTRAHRWTYPLFGPPPAPATVGATMVSLTRVDVEWSDASSASYLLLERERRNEDDTAWLPAVVVDSLDNLTTAYADSAITAPGRYRYRVSACNAHGCAGTQSNAVYVDVAPAAPSQLAAVGHPDSVVVSWTDGSDNETRFRLLRRRWDETTGWSAFRPVLELPAGATGATDTTVVTGELYKYRVRACNPIGCSPDADLRRAVAAAYPPAAPSGLTLSAPSPGTLLLGWSDVAGELRYEIDRRVRDPATGDWSNLVRVATLPENALSYEDTDVDAGTRYRYRVRACNYAGCSAFTNSPARTAQ